VGSFQANRPGSFSDLERQAMLRLSPGLGQGASRHLEKTIAHQSRAEEFKSGKNFPAKIDLKTNYPISEVKKKNRRRSENC
jgi:hypothetical protein